MAMEEKIDALALAVGRLETVEANRPKNTLKAVIALITFGGVAAAGWIWQAGRTFEQLDEVGRQVQEVRADLHDMTEQVVKLRERTSRLDGRGNP